VTKIFEAQGYISRLISHEFYAEYSSFSISCGPRVIYLTGVENSHHLQVVLISTIICININKFFVISLELYTTTLEK